MPQPVHINPGIVEKVTRLKASPHFNTIIEGSARYIEKQEILLVLCGKKPVSEVTSAVYLSTPHGRSSTPDDEKQVCKLLDSLGLAYRVWAGDYVTMAVVSLDPKLVSEYMDSLGRGYRNIGRLLGYPETAVEAYTTGRELAFEEQDRLMGDAGLPDLMPQFRLSRNHAHDELEVLKGWQQAIVAYGLERE